MMIHEIMERIELPEEAQKNVLKYNNMSRKEFLEWKNLFQNNFEIFLSKCKKKPGML